MHESRIKKLRDKRDLVNDEFEKYDNPSVIILNYIDLLLIADDGINMNELSEINSKLKSSFPLLSVWKFLIDEDIL